MGFLTAKYIIRWSYEYLRRYISYILFILTLALMLIGLNLVQVNFIQMIIDAALQKQWSLVINIICGFIIINVIRMTRNFVSGNLSNKLEAKICYDIKTKLVSKLFVTKLQEIESKTLGEMLNRYNDDVEKVSKFMLTGIQMLFFNPLMSICGFIYLFNYSWKLSIGVFLPIPFLAIILNLYSKRAGRIYEVGCKIKSDYTGNVYDITHGTETIIANQMTNWMKKKVSHITKNMYDNEIEYYKNGCSSLAFIMSVTYVPNIIIFVYGGWLAIHGEIEISLLFAYGQLMNLINTPVIELFSSLNEMREIEKSMKRLDDILLMEEESGGKETEIGNSNTVINFQNVSYMYGSESEKVFDDVTFEVHAGECIGIAGESGVGKTTLLNLLCGFYLPNKGNIYMWNYEIGNWDLSALRKKIAYVSQENQVIVGTVKENINYGCSSANQELIEKAAKLAGLDTFIQQLPNKYDTELRENMDEWSGGQYQRLSLARAFLQEADIYLFDEPTSSLDENNENIIWNSIEMLVKLNKTIIIVSHRLKLLKNCNKIYFMQKGKIIEQGTHLELVKLQGEYYRLFGGRNE